MALIQIGEYQLSGRLVLCGLPQFKDFFDNEVDLVGRVVFPVRIYQAEINRGFARDAVLQNGHVRHGRLIRAFEVFPPAPPVGQEINEAGSRLGSLQCYLGRFAAVYLRHVYLHLLEVFAIENVNIGRCAP